MSAAPPTAVAAPALEVEGLACSFGGVRAVQGASFAVPARGITGLIGPNGAGKSTVLNLVAGAIPTRSGSVRFLGQELGSLPSYRRARLGLIRTFQLSSEFARLTVLENLLVAAPPIRGERLREALRGRRYWQQAEWEAVERAREVLARFDMARLEDEYAGNLSGGQKRLVEIMRGVMAQPKLLLLDEPMAGVNPSLTRRIEAYLLELQREGLTMLMVEHELSVVERLCSPVVVMAAGRVLRQGEMAELRRDQEVLDAYLIG
ncbi:MAG: ABC transporter ATP-binding protein [Candidatus Dormibacteria bacterium]